MSKNDGGLKRYFDAPQIQVWTQGQPTGAVVTPNFFGAKPQPHPTPPPKQLLQTNF